MVKGLNQGRNNLSNEGGNWT